MDILLWIIGGVVVIGGGLAAWALYGWWRAR